MQGDMDGTKWLCRPWPQANATGSTRVSFDFRVIPGSLYLGTWAAGLVPHQ
jgi:hypothetical protein